MKKLILILLILVLSLSLTQADFNPIVSLEEAVNRANEQIGLKYYDINKINRDVYERYGALVYGEEHGDKKGNEYRYLGYTREENEDFNNPIFPRDDWAGGYLDDRNWIKEPWEEGLCKRNEFDNNPDYEAAIVHELETNYKDIYKDTFKDWYKYMHILQPPTDYAPGLGCMWHRNSAGLWYTAINIPALETAKALNKDYSTLIIRTGTENNLDGKPIANKENEAVIEYRVTEYEETTGIADIEIEINNSKNLKVEGLLEPKINGEKITGKLDMSEIYALSELQKYADFVRYIEISMDKQKWQYNKSIEVRNYTANEKIYKDAKGNYGNITKNELGISHIARMIKVKWTVKDTHRPVTIISKIKSFEDEKNADNNKDLVVIQNDDYLFSCFNDYTITLNTIYKTGDPKNKCTFWMMQPLNAGDDLEEEFLVGMRLWLYQDGNDYTTYHEKAPVHFKLNKDNPIVAVDFISDTPRYTLTIWRKGKELDKYKDDDVFKDQYFMGYEQIYNGEKYYFYKTYFSYNDGFFYPTQFGLSFMKKDKAKEFINRFGFDDFDKWDEAIK